MKDWSQMEAESKHRLAIDSYLEGDVDKSKELLGTVYVRKLDEEFLKKGRTIDEYLRETAEERCRKEITEVICNLRDLTGYRKVLRNYSRILGQEESEKIRNLLSEAAQEIRYGINRG